MKVLEIWQYQVSCYNHTTKTGGLFTEYINKFLKMKQEASGYPADCVTPEQRSEYVADFLQHERVSLDPTKIEKNEGRRSQAKLLLNSFWGK